MILLVIKVDAVVGGREAEVVVVIGAQCACVAVAAVKDLKKMSE